MNHDITILLCRESESCLPSSSMITPSKSTKILMAFMIYMLNDTAHPNCNCISPRFVFYAMHYHIDYFLSPLQNLGRWRIRCIWSIWCKYHSDWVCQLFPSPRTLQMWKYFPGNQLVPLTQKPKTFSDTILRLPKNCEYLYTF